MANKIARGTTGKADYEKSDVTLNAPFTWHIAYSGGIYTSGSPGGFAVSGATVSVPANAPISDTYRLTIITGPAGPSTSTYDSYLFEVVCMLEVVTIGSPTWNSTTNQWDYPVTVAAQGGTTPYSPSRPTNSTVSLSPGSSTNFTSSTSDSGACSASSSIPIGPAPLPPGGPSQGPGPGGSNGNGPDGPNDAGDGGTGDDGEGGQPPCQSCLCPEQADGSRPDCTGNLNQPRIQSHSQYGRIERDYGSTNAGHASPSMGIIRRF